MNERPWPDFDVVDGVGWSAQTRQEWEKAWEGNRKAAAEAGRPVRTKRIEGVPWGALWFEWADKGDGFDLYCQPVVAKTPDEAHKVQEIVGTSVPTQWLMGGTGAFAPTLLMLQTYGPHPLELVVAAGLGAAGFFAGRKYDANRRAAVRDFMSTDDLPVVLSPLRSIRRFSKPRGNRKLAAALERLYAEVVTDFWGTREYVGEAHEAEQALDAIEECVDALEGLAELGQLKPNHDLILQALETKKPAAEACTALATVLGGLRDDAAAAAAASTARSQELAVPRRTSPEERAINQQHAADLLAADAMPLEEARRRYREEAAAYDEGTQRYRDLP